MMVDEGDHAFRFEALKVWLSAYMIPEPEEDLVGMSMPTFVL